jgi:hypothetical protein
MNTPLPAWGEIVVEGEVVIDGRRVPVTLRAALPFRAWLESVQDTLESQQATLNDHETRIAALEP